ncbi:MAG: sugar acetyltransferase [Desulfosporosinus sp. BRH_c37]|nr:MAG: sugar acetyltransferase [Desulfosporosinus sp. BRH_c37]
MNRPVIVLGGGGHAKVLIDTLHIQSVKVLGFTDPDLGKAEESILGVPFIGDDDIICKYTPDQVLLVNGLGTTRRTSLRKQLFLKFKKSGYCFANVIHPSSIISSYVRLGEGVQVMAGAIIQTGSFIGDNSIVNTKVSIDHDCQIDPHVHIAPGVTLSGEVTVGEGAHIGTGAVVIQGIQIGRESLVAAGSVVIKDVAKGVTVKGVPAI